MAALEAAGIGFIEKNGSGPGVRLRINGQIHRRSFWLMNSIQHYPGTQGLFKKTHIRAFYLCSPYCRRDLNARAP